MTQRLRTLASRHWVSYDAEATLSGVDLLHLDFDRFLNVIYHFSTRAGSPEDIRRFDAQLWVPPRGVVPTEGPWAPDAETAAFRSVKAALGMKG